MDVIPYLLNLSFYHPILLPVLNTILTDDLAQKVSSLTIKLNKLVQLNAKFRRSDGMCWALYYLIKFRREIDSGSINEVIKTKDCLPMLLLYKSGDKEGHKLVIKFANKLDKKDLYNLDNYWILLYQLYLDNKIEQPYQNDKTFQILRDANISFVKDNA